MTKKTFECCDAMRYALGEGYLYCPIQFTDLKILPPTMHGPLLSPRSRKTKPSLIFSFCPWCGQKMMTSISTGP